MQAMEAGLGVGVVTSDRPWSAGTLTASRPRSFAADLPLKDGIWVPLLPSHVRTPKAQAPRRHLVILHSKASASVRAERFRGCIFSSEERHPGNQDHPRDCQSPF